MGGRVLLENCLQDFLTRLLITQRVVGITLFGEVNVADVARPDFRKK